MCGRCLDRFSDEAADSSREAWSATTTAAKGLAVDSFGVLE
jgi:hypothetical protein